MVGTIMIFLSVISSGLWRAWYGMEKNFPPKIVVKGLGVALAAIIGFLAIGLPYGPVLGLLAAVNMIMAVSKGIDEGWSSWFMGLRYSLPAALMVAPGWFGLYDINYYGIPYVLACVAAGLIYPIASVRPGTLIRINWRVVEFIAGAGVIGGLALL